MPDPQKGAKLPNPIKEGKETDKVRQVPKDMKPRCTSRKDRTTRKRAVKPDR